MEPIQLEGVRIYIEARSENETIVVHQGIFTTYHCEMQTWFVMLLLQKKSYREKGEAAPNAGKGQRGRD